MINALKANWKLYIIEAWALGMFMISACVCTILIEHPDFHISTFLVPPFWRRLLSGIAMGITAILLIYSKWGKHSGAHMNPAVTLANLHLDRMQWPDTIWYIISQIIGASCSVAFIYILLPTYVSSNEVNFVVTTPGIYGVAIAFIAEMLMAAILFAIVLLVSNSSKAKYTGYIAGLMVCCFIWFEAPLSGMSINPARSFGSALNAGVWSSFWIYIIAPIAGMQISAWLYRKKYLQTKGECKSMNCHFSGDGSTNKIYKVWKWWQKDATNQLIEYKIK